MTNRLSFIRGDTTKLQVTITTYDGAPLSLVGITDIRFTLKRSNQDSDRGAVFQGTLGGGNLEIISSSGGVIEVTVPPSVSSQMRFGRVYFWDVQLKDAEAVYTPIIGEAVVVLDSSNG